jgi:hypothetical protein
MTTRLESAVTRETSLEVDRRAVNVTLMPADPARAAPVALELHLKGTQQRRLIPLHILVDAIWPPKIKKNAAAAAPETGALNLDREQLDVLVRMLASFKR